MNTRLLSALIITGALLITSVASAQLPSVFIDLDRNTSGVQATLDKSTAAGTTIEGAVHMVGTTTVTKVEGYAIRVIVEPASAVTAVTTGGQGGDSSSLAEGYAERRWLQIFEPFQNIPLPGDLMTFDITLADPLPSGDITLRFGTTVETQGSTGINIDLLAGSVIQFEDESIDMNTAAVQDSQITPVITDTPTDTPVTETPTATPTFTDTPISTDTPTSTPTVIPSDTPTEVPTEEGGYILLDVYGGAHLQGTALALLPQTGNPNEYFPYFHSYDTDTSWDQAVDIEILPDKTTRKELTSHGVIWTIVQGATTTSDWTHADFTEEFGKWVAVKSSGIGTGVYLLDKYGTVVPYGDANPALAVTGALPGGSLVEGVTDTDLLLRAVDLEVNSAEDTVYVLDSFGGVHVTGAGDMQVLPYFGWDIARDMEFFTANEDICVLDGFGAVNPASGEALPDEFSGSMENTRSLPYFGWDIARDLEFTPDFMSAWVLDGLGPAHSSGFAPIVPGLWFGWDAAVDLEIYLGETQFAN